MDPVLYLNPTNLFICALVCVGTVGAFLWFRSPDSSSTNNEDTERAPAVETDHSLVDLPAEETKNKIEEERNYYKARVIDTDQQSQQKDKEIEDLIRERAGFLDQIRAQDEEIQKAREKEIILHNRLEELDKECYRMKESSSRWEPLLKTRKDALLAKDAEYKYLQDKYVKMRGEVNMHLERHHKDDENIQNKIEEIFRQNKTIQKLDTEFGEEKLRLDIILLEKETKIQGKDETIEKLIKEKSRKDETIQRLNEKNFRLMVCLLICVLIAVFLGFNTTQLSTECPDSKWTISIHGNTFISGP